MMERVAFAEKKSHFYIKFVLKLEKTMLLTNVNANKNNLD